MDKGERACSVYVDFQREKRYVKQINHVFIFLTGNLTTRIACFIVLSHNLAEYNRQIYIFYPVSQKYLADLCSYVHCILLSGLCPVSFKREVAYTRAKSY